MHIVWCVLRDVCGAGRTENIRGRLLTLPTRNLPSAARAFHAGGTLIMGPCESWRRREEGASKPSVAPSAEVRVRMFQECV